MLSVLGNIALPFIVNSSIYNWQHCCGVLHSPLSPNNCWCLWISQCWQSFGLSKGQHLLSSCGLDQEADLHFTLYHHSQLWNQFPHLQVCFVSRHSWLGLIRENYYHSFVGNTFRREFNRMLGKDIDHYSTKILFFQRLDQILWTGRCESKNIHVWDVSQVK